jgi:hypothetical protein
MDWIKVTKNRGTNIGFCKHVHESLGSIKA